MSNYEQIKQALESLNVDVDEHWTTSGEPAMKSVNNAIDGDVEISRADIKAAFPNFTRSNVTFDPLPDDLPSTSIGDAQASPSLSDGGESEDYEDARKVVEDKEREAHEAHKALEVARKAFDTAQAERELAYPPQSQTDAFKAIIQNEMKEAESLEEKIKALIDQHNAGY